MAYAILTMNFLYYLYGLLFLYWIKLQINNNITGTKSIEPLSGGMPFYVIYNVIMYG